MSGLPEGWVEVPLHEIADVIRGVTYKKEESVDASKDGFVAVLRATNITGMSLTFEGLVYVPANNVSTEQLLRTGDVVVASSSGSKEIVGKAGAFARDGFIGSFGAFCTGVRPSPQLSSALFGYYFQTPSYRKSVSELSAGSNINNLKAGDLASQVFPLAPHAEQVRIVAKLEELLSDLDAGVAELKAAQKKLQQYRQSLLKAAVEGALTAPWREAQRKLGTPTETGAQLLQRILTERRARWEAKQLAKFKEQGKTPPKDLQKKYPEPVQPDTGDLPGLPEGWVWATYEQVSTRVTVGHVGPMKDYYSSSGIPFLRSQNVRENRFSAEGLLYVPMDFHESLSKSKVRPGDIAVVRSGAVGTACAIPDSLPEANCSDLVLVQEPIGVVPEFGAYYLNSAARADIRRGQSGIALTHFNTKAVAALKIAVPPIAEQEAIVRIVEEQLASIERREADVSVALNQSTVQRQNILRAAFAGQLVPQDPNDEPAGVLLERIRAERDSQATQQKPRAREARALA